MLIKNFFLTKVNKNFVHTFFSWSKTWNKKWAMSYHCEVRLRLVQNMGMGLFKMFVYLYRVEWIIWSNFIFHLSWCQWLFWKRWVIKDGFEAVDVTLLVDNNMVALVVLKSNTFWSVMQICNPVETWVCEKWEPKISYFKFTW